MTKPKTKPRLVNEVQGAAPVAIDREAEVLEPVPGTEPEILMPTAENEPPKQMFMYVPAQGVTTLEILELAMMRTVQLISPGVVVEPGALRQLILAEDRVAALSPEAQRLMHPMAPAPAPVATEAA